MLRFYVDASMLAVGKALVAVRADVTYPGRADSPVASADVDDSDWLPLVGAANLAVLMRDKKIRSRPAERQALAAANVRAFVLARSGNSSRWEQLALVVRWWDAMEEVLATEEPPFVFSITGAGLRKLILAV